jgi:hypothetical protein
MCECVCAQNFNYAIDSHIQRCYKRARARDHLAGDLLCKSPYNRHQASTLGPGYAGKLIIRLSTTGLPTVK